MTLLWNRNAKLIRTNTYIDIFEIFKSSIKTAFVWREIKFSHQILSATNLFYYSLRHEGGQNTKGYGGNKVCGQGKVFIIFSI